MDVSVADPALRIFSVRTNHDGQDETPDRMAGGSLTSSQYAVPLSSAWRMSPDATASACTIMSWISSSE